VSAPPGRICDGCGQVGDVEGLAEVPVLDYCSECMPQVRAFLREIDDLHTTMVKQWETELQAARDRYCSLKELPY
jgi:hypothetical protein